MAEKMILLNVRISRNLRQELKLYCVKNHITITDFVSELIKNAIGSDSDNGETENNTKSN